MAYDKPMLVSFRIRNGRESSVIYDLSYTPEPIDVVLLSYSICNFHFINVGR